MNIEELKKQAETEIADFIAQKIAELRQYSAGEVLEWGIQNAKELFSIEL